MARDFPGSGKVYRIVEPTVGFTLNPDAIDFYWSEVPIAGVHCPDCRSPLDYTAVSTSVDIARHRDITSAGLRTVVSESFRDFCVSHGYMDVEFLPVDTKWPMFEIRPTRVLRVDWDASQPRFTRLCPRCGQFECILFGEGLFLKGVDKPLEEGIYRTDLIWGCHSNKSPEIIVAEQTMRKIKRAGFKGVYFWPVPYIRLLRPSEPQGNRGYR